MIDILLLQIPDMHTWIFSNKDENRMKKLKMCPLGIMYLASYARKNGFTPAVIDLNMYMTREDRKRIIEEFILENNPKVIGVSSYTADYDEARYIFRVCKQIAPQIPILYGGPHATFTYEESLIKNPIDLVLRFEGERCLVNVLNYYIHGIGALEQIKGIAYKDNGKVIKNLREPFITDLDELPFPARDLIDINRYISPGTILTSRGCIGRCIFCTASAMSGGNHRVRSVDNIIAEIEEMYFRYNIRHFNFVDDTFTVYKERNMGICEKLKKIGDGDITFDCESRVDCVDQELLNTMKAAGCIGIQFGVESGDQFILKEIKKGINLQQVRMAVDMARKAGIGHIFCGFMIGHPEDTYESIQNTINFMLELKKQGVALGLSISTPFPGTYLYNNLEKLGCKLLTKKWVNYSLNQCIYETKHLSAQDIKKLHTKASEIVYNA